MEVQTSTAEVESVPRGGVVGLAGTGISHRDLDVRCQPPSLKPQLPKPPARWPLFCIRLTTRQCHEVRDHVPRSSLAPPALYCKAAYQAAGEDPA